MASSGPSAAGGAAGAGSEGSGNSLFSLPSMAHFGLDSPPDAVVLVAAAVTKALPAAPQGGEPSGGALPGSPHQGSGSDAFTIGSASDPL